MSCFIDVQLVGFKIFSEREVEGSGCGDGFVLNFFHELVFGRPIVHIM